MMHKCLCSQILGKLALLSVVAVICVRPSYAQKDLQVMVAGPWSYVTDPAFPNMILLVAPGMSANHAVYILPGTNPVINPNTPPSPTPIGSYTLNYTATKAKYVPTGLTPTVCGASISAPSTNVTPILKNSSNTNYVISLPTPDGYSMYPGHYGSSESEVSSTPILAANSAPPQVRYTTWMVLHYSVKKLPKSFQMTGSLTKTVAVSSGGISIVLGDNGKYDKNCDGVSLESVKERNSLWTLKQYARFPTQISSGEQNPGQYDFDDCPDSGPLLNKAEPEVMLKKDMFSPGSADCHACQMSVNGAVSGATVSSTVGR